MDFPQEIARPLTLEERAARAALPFAVLQDLGVPCAYERSVKISAGKLLANRYLLGFAPDSLSRPQLATALRRLLMPEPRLENFMSQVEAANLLLLGFEEDGQRCTY